MEEGRETEKRGVGGKERRRKEKGSSGRGRKGLKCIPAVYAPQYKIMYPPLGVTHIFNISVWICQSISIQVCPHICSERNLSLQTAARPTNVVRSLI